MRKALSLALAAMLLLAALPTWTPAAQAQPADPAEIVPAAAPFYLAIDTRAGFTTKLERLVSRLTGEDVSDMGAQTLDQLVQALIGDPDARFADDIRPWLGDLVAVANPQMPSISALMMMANPSALPPGVAPVVIAPVTDLPAAQDFMARLAQFVAPAYTVSDGETYNGYDYTVLQPIDNSNPRAGLSFGFVGDYLVVGAGARALEPIIDVAAGAPALADEAGFRRVYGAMDPDSALRLYVGPSVPAGIIGDPVVWNMLTPSLQSGEVELPGLDTSDPAALQQQLLAAIDTFHGIGLGFRSVANALVMDFIGGFDMAALDALTGEPLPRLERGVGAPIIARFPADTLGVVASVGLAGSFAQWRAMAEMQEPGMAEELEAAFAEFEAQTGLTVEDVLAWLGGSYAAGFFAGANPTPDLPVDLALVIEATDVEKARATIDALVAATEEQGVTTGRRAIDGVDVITIPPEAPDGPPVEVALFDGYVTLTSGAGMDRMIAAARGGDNYTQTPAWAQLMGIANADGPFLATLDLAGLITLAQDISDPSTMTEADRQALAQLKALDAAAIIAPASPDGGPARVSFIITLGE